MLVYTTGQGVHGFTLDPTIGELLLVPDDAERPAQDRYRTAEQTADEAARGRERGRRRVRRADSLGRGRRGSQVSDRKAVYGPDDWQVEPGRELGAPGAYPYTRGVHP